MVSGVLKMKKVAVELQDFAHIMSQKNVHEGEYPGVEAFTPYSKYRQDESAFDMAQRGERGTYYPYLEHYQPTRPSRRSESDVSGSSGAEEVEMVPPKRKKKAKRRANRAALEHRREGMAQTEMETFKEFASTVTADYLAEMCSKASTGRRLIWISLWLISFVYAWYNIAVSIGLFLSKPTATKLNFYEASREGVKFPTVTLCNFNKYNASYFVSDEPYKGQLKAFLKESTPIWGHKEKITEKSWNSKYPLIRAMNVQKLLDVTSQTLDDTVEYCRYGGKKCTNQNGDESDDPTVSFRKLYTEHGLCYAFNSDGYMNMTRTGALYGLSLRLHVAQNDYFETQDVAGFKVLLHNSYEPPMIEEYGFALRPGSETYVRIRLSKFKDTERPLGYCDPSLESQFGGGYTISKCIMQYRANNTIAECNCRAFYMEGDADVCNLYQEQTCVEPLLEKMALGTLVIKGKPIADPDCPSPCIYTTYSYTISQSEYPSLAVKDELIANVNKDRGIPAGENESWSIQNIRDNYLKVHIYFEELSTLEMERHPSYLIANLIGDVGGQLGLLLGMNICSLVQFSDYIIRFSFIKGFMRLVKYYQIKR